MICDLPAEAASPRTPTRYDYEESRLPSPLIPPESRYEPQVPGADATLRVEAKMSPLAPVLDFLLAESYLLWGKPDRSYEIYVDLVERAAEESRSDKWAGGVLASVSLMRSVQLLRAGSEPDENEARHLLDLSRPILSVGPPNRILQIPVLGGIPQVEENILQNLALLAWSIGDTSAALPAFTKYLEIASAVELTPEEIELTDYIISSGFASEGELALLRGKRFYALRRVEDAARFLRAALAGDNPEVRAEAGYYLARAISVQGAPAKKVWDILTSAMRETADPDLAQEILFYRAAVSRGERGRRNTYRFAEDLTTIIEQFPEGQLADDALYELARHHETSGDTERALQYFSRLRNHDGPNNWFESAHFRPALILYTRGKPGDTEEVERLLRGLVASNPSGDLALAAMFWLGRIAFERGDTLSARSRFEEVIETCSYDYYAIRARMHLNMGGDAAKAVCTDPKTLEQLKHTHMASRSGGSAPGDSPHHHRLRRALQSGLYSRALAASERAREVFPSRLPSEMPIDELDRAGALTSLAVLLSLRQDAVAAATQSSDAANRLSVASAVGQAGGDWPLAMLLVFGLDRSLGTQSSMQHDPQYLPVAYPPVYADLIHNAAEANHVPPDLLYGIMRRESLFYPAALSKRGAIGLFQFMPAVFAVLDERWNLLGGTGIPSMEAFLFDPRMTIDLGARWFGEELLKRNDGNILLAVMEHNAGYPAVKAWLEYWESAGRSEDVEYMVETARFTETRIFTRSVLTDIALADAMGLFKTGDNASSHK